VSHSGFRCHCINHTHVSDDFFEKRELRDGYSRGQHPAIVLPAATDRTKSASPGFGEGHHLCIRTRQASGWLPVECSAVSCPTSLTYRPLACLHLLQRLASLSGLRSATLGDVWCESATVSSGIAAFRKRVDNSQREGTTTTALLEMAPSCLPIFGLLA
jgi:hypothetical protein